MIDRIKAAALKAWQSADLQALFNKLGGKSFLIVAFFALTGFWLEMHGKLTADYAGLATALSAFHIGRAIAQDKFGK